MKKLTFIPKMEDIGHKLLCWMATYKRFTLLVTQDCQLKCEHCHLWQDDKKKYTPTLLQLIRKKTFHSTYPFVTSLDVIGGDPFSFTYLPRVLQYLFRHKIAVSLWINGQAPLEKLEAMLPWVSEVYLYLPSIEKEHYREIVGYDGLDQAKAALALLVEKKVPVTIQTRVTPTNIQELPDFYELAYQYSMPFLFHYPKQHGLSKDSIDYIHRFKQVRGGSIVKKTPQSKAYCAGYPFPIKKKGYWNFRKWGLMSLHRGEFIKNAV